MRFHVVALGCKLNQAEVEDIQRELLSRGQEIVDSPDQADWAVINTCTVTHIAARKSRRLIRHLRRQNQALKLAVTGCCAQISNQETQELDGVELVVVNEDKSTLVERLLETALAHDSRPVTLRNASLTAPLIGGHTRAFVKVQDGCDNHCTYCIVTVARGPSHSQSPQEVLTRVQRRLSEGYREIVLTGVNIGAYGRDLATDPDGSSQWGLARLVRMLLTQTRVERLRLSSLEPWDVTEELVELWCDARLCRHFHLPLQSGCDATLRRMGRLGDTAAYARVVELIRRRVPGVAITADVIVGFPGETEQDFGQTCAFVAAMAFSRLHVFRYSRRPGTVAERMPGQIDPRVAQAQSQHLSALGEQLQMQFSQRLVGQEVQVLFESLRADGDRAVWSGLTDTYVRVLAESKLPLHNQLAQVRCLRGESEGVYGEIVATPSPRNQVH